MQESFTPITPSKRTVAFVRLMQVGEIAGVLIVGGATIMTGLTIMGEGPLSSIVSIWATNLVMVSLIYLGLRSRGQNWSHLGLAIGKPTWRATGKAFLQSIPIFVGAIVSFVVAAIVMANMVGVPEEADMSKYDYLRGNLLLTMVALLSVYMVSSFAEEVIYRGFLITRAKELGGSGVVTTVLAVAFSSVIFGLVHSDWGIAGMVQATCMGLALGASYLIVKRNLWVTILAHAYMDTILILQMYVATE